jgi:hypothetical protein
MARARRCAAVGVPISPSAIAPSSAPIGAAKARSKSKAAAADSRTWFGSHTTNHRCDADVKGFEEKG